MLAYKACENVSTEFFSILTFHIDSFQTLANRVDIESRDASVLDGIEGEETSSVKAIIL